MKIPKKYTLGAVDWTVKLEESIPGAIGMTLRDEATVLVLNKLPTEVKGQTYCHELVHTILFSMGKPAAEHDEVFVDAFATFLHQYLKQHK